MRPIKTIPLISRTDGAGGPVGNRLTQVYLNGNSSSGSSSSVVQFVIFLLF